MIVCTQKSLESSLCNSAQPVPVLNQFKVKGGYQTNQWSNDGDFLYVSWHLYMWTSRREDKFSSFFRSSPDLKYPPEFSWLLHVPPVFSWLLHVHVPNVQFAPCAFRPRKQDAIWMTYLWYFESLHSVEVFFSHFKICFNNFIYPPWVDYFTLGW